MNFKDKPYYVAQGYIHSLMTEKRGESCFHFTPQFLTWNFKQRVLLRGIFSLLKKTFIKLTEIQNSNLKHENKTT